MQYHYTLLLLLLISTAASSSPPASGNTGRPASFVLAACARARYPSLCVRTLAPAAPGAPTDLDLAIAAISVSLTCLHSTVSSLRHLPTPVPVPGPLRDCFQQLSDSADQLSKTKSELAALKSDNDDRLKIDDACTWVSAALTNEDTCLDGVKGMDDEETKGMVTRRVRGVERLTTNALYFVAMLAQKNP